MSMKTSLITYLTADAGVSALVGSRVGFGHASHGDDLPYVIAQQVSRDDKRHMAAATGKAIARFQFDCYAVLPDDAHAVGDALRTALHGFRGSMGDVFVSSCSLENEIDGFDDPSGGEQDGINRVSQDYIIGWTVSVPSF